MPSDESEKNPTATESLEREKATLDDRLKTGESDAKRFVSEAETEIKKVSEQVTKDGEAIKKYHTDTSTATIAELARVRKDITKTLLKSTNSVRAYLSIQIALLVIVAVLGGYVSTKISQNIFYGFEISWFVVSAIVILRIRSQLQRIAQHSRIIEEKVDEFNEKIVNTSSAYPNPKNDTSTAVKMFAMLRESVGQVISVAGSFMPFIDKFERALILDQFIDKFCFALKKYDFDSYSSDVIRSLVGKVQVSSNETEWLNGLSEVASSRFGGKPAQIFKLMYYESWDRDNISAVWAEVRGNSREVCPLRKSFAELLVSHKLVDTFGLGEHAIGSVADLIFGMEDYSLVDLQTRAKVFFRDLNSFKSKCIDVLESYDLGYVLQKEGLMDLSPESSDPKEWQDEVLDYVAMKVFEKTGGETPSDSNAITGGEATNQIQVLLQPFVAEKLILVEGVGDAAREALWKSILHSESAEFFVEKLASLLTKKRVRRLHKEFSREVFLRHLILVMKASIDDFRIQRIEDELERVEQEILKVKRGISRTNDKFRLELNDMTFVDDYVPINITQIEEELVAELNKRTKVDLDVAKLIYYLTIVSDKSVEIYKEMIRSNRLQALGAFLVDKKFIPNRQFNENIPVLLANQPTFDPASFADLYAKYEKLMSKLGSFLNFLNRQQIAGVSTLPTFENILEKCKKVENEFADMFFEVSLLMVSKTVEVITLEQAQHFELAKAACALSMSLENDRASEKLAEELYWETFGATVLFEYSRLYVANLAKEKATLKEAVLKAVSSRTTDPNFAFYREKLHSGIIVVSEDTLLSMRKDEFASILKKNEKLGLENDVLKNYEKSIKEFMSQIKPAVTSEFLAAGVFSAYLMTIPHSTALIGFINDHADALKKSEKQLADESHDLRYLVLRQYDEGSGAGTRIGLVPYGMKFEEFAYMFEKLFERAKEISNISEPLNFYITRIFPSKDALKEIMQANPTKVKPLETVEYLIKRFIVGSNGISVLALLDPNANSTIAFNTVISSLIDNPSNNLYTLTRDMVSDIVKQNSGILDSFVNGAVDLGLYSTYDVGTLTSLCKKMESAAKTTSVESTRLDFEVNLVKILPTIISLGVEAQQRLSAVLFKRLLIVGTVLNS